MTIVTNLFNQSKIVFVTLHFALNGTDVWSYLVVKADNGLHAGLDSFFLFAVFVRFIICVKISNKKISLVHTHTDTHNINSLN